MNTVRWIFIILALYLPLESYVLAWVTGNAQSVLLLKQASDLVVVLTFLYFLFVRSHQRHRKLRDIAPGAALLFTYFILSAIVASITNDSDPLTALLQVKATLRYVLVAYVVANIGFPRKFLDRFVFFVGAAATLQLALALIQIAAPSTASALSPFEQIVSVGNSSLVSTSVAENKNGIAAYGASLNTIEFAFFMSAWWIMFSSLSRTRNSNSILISTILFFVTLILVFYSQSRISVFAFICSSAFYFSRSFFGDRHSVTNTTLGSMVVFIALITAVDLNLVDISNADYFSFLSNDYLRVAQLQRLGLIGTFNDILSNPSPQLIWGFGPDPSKVVDSLYLNDYSIPYLLTFNPNAIEDTYWISILIFYGLVGGGAFLAPVLLVFYRSIKSINQKKSSLYVKNIDSTIIGLFIFLFIAGFFNQVLEVKQYSYYFWFFTGLRSSLNGAAASPRRNPEPRDSALITRQRT